MRDKTYSVKIILPKILTDVLSNSIELKLEFEFEIPPQINDGNFGVSGKTINDENRHELAQRMYANIASKIIETIKPIQEANSKNSWKEFGKQILFDTLPDILDSAKLLVEWRRSQLFHKNNTKKGEFERAADCYGAIPSVLEHSLAYIKSGYYFNDDTKFIKKISE